MRRVWILTSGSIVLLWALFNHSLFLSWLSRFFSIISPLVAGGAIAFVLNVPVRAIERKIIRKGRPSLRRSLSMLLTFLMTLVVFALLFLIVIPEFVSAIERLIAVIPGSLDALRVFGDSLGERFPDLGFWMGELDLSWNTIKSDVVALLKQSSAALVGSTVTLASSLFNGVVNFILALVFSLYMLARKEQLAAQAKRVLFAFAPDHVGRKLIHIARVAESTFSRFVAGACMEAVILGAMFLVSMLIFRFPYAILVSAVVSISALIPIVGAFIAALVGMILMVANDPMQALWFLLLFLVLQQVEGNLIYPRVVGDSIGLPALWVLAAVLVGGSLFGVLGMLAGVPFVAVLYVLLKELTIHRLAEKERMARSLPAGESP